MVLMPGRMLRLASLCALLGTSACAKKKVVLRTVDALDVRAAWVVDREGDVPPAAAPDAVVHDLDGVLTLRHLDQDVVDASVWSDAFTRRRATAHRLAWLGEQTTAGDLLLLVELRPYFDNLSQGRFRWIVAANVTLMPAGAPERALDKSFEIPVFLQFRYEEGDAAMVAAKGELTRRISKLVDAVLQDPDATWTIDGDGSEGEGSDGASTDAVAPIELKGSYAPRIPPRGPPPASGRGPLYFVMLDRFANGDASNDGSVDRADPQAFHGGDLAGLTAHLDHIASMGFHGVWLSPVTQMQHAPFGKTGAFHGYWMTDPMALDPHLGSAEDLTALNRGLQQRGMGLMLDVVTNHVGYDSALMADRPDWFHDVGTIDDWNDVTQVQQGQVHGLPDLNQDNPEVYAWLRDAASSWVSRVRPMGFRLDAVRHVSPAFWKTYNADVAAMAGPGFLQVGELFDGNPVAVDQTWRAGGFGQMLDFPLYYGLIDAVCKGGNPASLAALLDVDRVYPDAAGLLTFVDNHDLPRVASACGASVPDALTLIYGLRGIPTVMYGTESGLKGAEEPANRADMVFSPTPLAEHLTTLAKLRASHGALRSASSRALAAHEDGMAVLASTAREAVVVAVAKQPMVVGLKEATLPQVTGAVDLLTGKAVPVISGVNGGVASLRVPAGVSLIALTTAGDLSGTVAWVESTSTETVRFEAEAPGAQGVVVVGGAPELGGWSPAEGLKLTKQGARWVGEVTMPVGQVLAYKLATVNGNTVTWEDGPNRTLFSPKEPPVARVTWGKRG